MLIIVRRIATLILLLCIIDVSSLSSTTLRIILVNSLSGFRRHMLLEFRCVHGWKAAPEISETHESNQTKDHVDEYKWRVIRYLNLQNQTAVVTTETVQQLLEVPSSAKAETFFWGVTLKGIFKLRYAEVSVSPYTLGTVDWHFLPAALMTSDIESRAKSQ